MELGRRILKLGTVPGIYFLGTTLPCVAAPAIAAAGPAAAPPSSLAVGLGIALLGSLSLAGVLLQQLRGVARQLELETTARKRSETLLNSIVGNLPIAVVIKEAAELRFVEWNKANETLCGISQAEVLGKTDYDLFPKEQAEFFVGKDREAIRNRRLVDHEEEILTRKQGVRTLRTRKIPIMDEQGKPLYLLGIFEDITDRKLAQARLLESQALYLSLVEHLPANVYRKDVEGRFVFVNSRFCEFKGMAAAELLGKTVREIASPDSAGKFVDEDRIILETGQSIEQEEERHDLGSQTMHFHVLKSPVFNARGAVVGIQGMFFDITQRKQAEAALAYERDLLRTLLDNSPDQIYFKDAQSRFVKCSTSQARRFGTTPDGAVGKTDFDFFAEEHARPAFEDEREIVRTGQPLIGKIEHEIRRGGEEAWVLTNKLPLRNAAGTIIGTFGISKDITAMKQVESALAYERDLLRALLDNSPDMIYFKDEQSRFIKSSKSLNERFGLTPEEMTGKRDFDLVDEAQARPWFEDEQEIIRTGRPLIGKIDREVHQEARQTCWVLTNKLPLRNAEGKIIGTFGISKDITAMKQVESALAYERDLLRALLDNSPDMIYFKDEQSRFIKCSRSLHKRFGLSPEEVIGKCDFDLFGEAHAGPAFADEREIIRTGQPLIGKIEREVYKEAAEVSWVLTNKLPLRDAAGKIIGTFGISKDITVLKQVETELACERDLLRTLLDNSPDQIYFKDAQSRFVKCSKSLSERFHTTPEQLPGRSDFDFFGGEHARSAFADEQEIIRTGSPVIGKIEREVWQNGRDCTWVLTNKLPLRNAAGAIIGTFGISKDITAIKQAEAKLEEIHKQLLETSRLAGMAEVATSVLHNVGNVLNSVNISSSLVAEKVRHSKAGNLSKAVALMEAHGDDLAAFFTGDPKGRQLPGYLAGLARHLAREQEDVMRELSSLCSNVDHIKEIVAMQQSYARVSGVRELLPVVELVEDALRMNAGAMERHQIEVVREYSPVPPVLVDKHKVLQILVNLIRNAKYAVDENQPGGKRIILRIASNGNRAARISVIDNGVGIPAENLVRIFEHGFTTRKDGHGFGLHSGALAARELGGALTVASSGPGLGAAFTLEVPCQAGEGTP